MQAMQFQQGLRKLGGARAVPAATAFAGRNDPRLEPPDGDGKHDGKESSTDQTAEVSKP
jgi:hypothetical protein